MSDSNLVQLLVRCTRDERKAFRKMALELDTSVQEMVMSLCRDAHASWLARQAAAKKQNPPRVRSVKPEGSTRGVAGLIKDTIQPKRPKRQRLKPSPVNEVCVGPISSPPPRGDLTVSKLGADWFVFSGNMGDIEAGPFDNNSQAWKWIERSTGDYHSPAEKRLAHRWASP